jgi:hypothetical protein
MGQYCCEVGGSSHPLIWHSAAIDLVAAKSRKKPVTLDVGGVLAIRLGQFAPVLCNRFMG